MSTPTSRKMETLRGKLHIMNKNKYSSDMKKQINDLLLKMQTGENCIGETANELLNLFSVSKRYSLDYLDSMKIEQKVEVWAKNQDDALAELKDIDPKATYIFISRL